MLLVCKAYPRYDTLVKVMLNKQKQRTTAKVRLNVTVCLYLSPRNKARTLSTLIATEIISETPYKIEDVATIK